ncbi:MAG: Uma2 family endonuclease [Microcoleus sp.]
MTVASQKMSLEEYLNFDDGTETRYELENGELIVMPPESDLNQRIAIFLLVYFAQQGIPSHRLRVGAEIVVSSSRAGSRLPDLMVLSEELATALEGSRRSTIMMDMPPPLLVVEVVSPHQENRDYRYKRSEYAARRIPEYWIVDPIQQRVTVLEWVEGLYEEVVYTGDSALAEPSKRIVSPVLGVLELTASRLLQGR